MVGGGGATATTGARGAENDLLRDTVRVLIDRLYAQRRPSTSRERAEDSAAALSNARSPPGRSDDVVEHTRAGRELGLPRVADIAGDRAGRICGADVVRISDAGDRRPQEVAGLDGAAIEVGDRQTPSGAGIETRRKLHRLISKLQPLDVRQVVDAITRRDAVVGHGDDVVGGSRAACRCC